MASPFFLLALDVVMACLRICKPLHVFIYNFQWTFAYIVFVVFIKLYIMKQKCCFKKGADILQTVQGLQTSIPDAIDYYRIKDTSCPSSYNNQKSTSEVGSRIREPFDVIEYDRSFTRLRKYMKDELTKEKQTNS